MATYKVIQDIEAEDKLLGPLTLKQFIFAGIAAGFAFVAFLVVSKTQIIYLAIPFLPFIGAFGILAAPLSKDQPTDLWLAARIRFFIKPRKRIWDQSGLKELVTITVPKKEIKQLTNNLSQHEVKSRLSALANTLDSRGWVVKNVAINMYANPSFAYAYDGGEQRLLDPSSLPTAVSEIDLTNTEDILDSKSNPTAQHFEELIQESGANQKATAIANMQTAISKAKVTTELAGANTIESPDGEKFSVPSPDSQDIEQTSNSQPNFMSQPPATSASSSNAIDPEDSSSSQVYSANAEPDNTVNLNPKNNDSLVAETEEPTIYEQQLLEHIKEEKKQLSTKDPRHKVVKTPEQLAEEQKARQEVEKIEKELEFKKAQAMTAQQNPVNIELAKADDISVETISKLANRNPRQTNGEVIVNLR